MNNELYALIAMGYRTSFYSSLEDALIALRKSGAESIEHIGFGIIYVRKETE